MSDDTIYRQAAIDAMAELQGRAYTKAELKGISKAWKRIKQLPSAQTEIIHCGECKHWRQQTNYAGAPLSFGFCESDDVWQSLYGETYEIEHIDTDEDFYCGYAERRTDE